LEKQPGKIDLSWIALLFLTTFWFSATSIYEPAQSFAIGFIIAALFVSFVSRRSFIDGSSQTILMLASQAAVYPFLYWIFTRCHAESIFAFISGNLLSLTGLPVSVEGGVIYIDSALRTLVIASTWEKTGAFHFLLMVAGGLVLLALNKANSRKYLVFFGTTFLYMTLRYTFILAVYSHYSIHNIFWERTFTFVLLLPYVLILSLLFRKSPEPSYSPRALLKFSFLKEKNRRRLDVLTIAAFAVLVFFGTAFFGLQDTGHEKPGRVVVDEYHSNWEWTDEAYDENWFGERSGYNYYCFYEHISRFYETSRNTSQITSETLSDADILILKTPTSPYSDGEVDAIWKFVKEGGGLYLIGDHTNVFGTSAYLNKIAEPLGLRFRYDCTYELVWGSLQEYEAPKLLPHPVVKDMPFFLFATSCTLEASPLAEEIISGYGLRNLPLDYSQKNFFPSDTNSALLEFGTFVQCAGITYGKGRVLAFTDSTVFSNFWMFMPGKPELLLKSLQWLNRENAIPFPVRIFAIAGLAAMFAVLIFTVFRYRRRKLIFPAGLCLLAGIIVFVSSVAVFNAGSDAIKMPDPRKEITQICFESAYTTGAVPKDINGFMAHMSRQFSTFYVWTQRLGCVPSLEEDPVKALEKGDVAVVLKPGRPLAENEQILRLVNSGKTLLILDNSENSNELLDAAGIRISPAEMTDFASAEQLFGEPFELPLTEGAAAVIGGQALISDHNGNAVFSIQPVGNGTIAVFSDPDLYYNLNLGDISANLNEKTSVLTLLEFEIFKYLLSEIE